MKKIFKSLTVIFSFFLVVIISGCSCARSKEFSSDAGIKITLTDEFNEKTIVGQTLYLESKDAIFVALKEEFVNLNDALDNAESASKKQYASVVLRVNGLTSQIVEDSDNNLVYFSYTKKVTGRDFYYLAVIEKGSDAFWLCQFACLEESKDKFEDKFIEYSKTIEVE